MSICINKHYHSVNCFKGSRRDRLIGAIFITLIVILALVIGMGIVFLGDNPNSTTSSEAKTATGPPTLNKTTPDPALCKRGEELWWAANGGNLTAVKNLLKCPNIDVNLNIDTVATDIANWHRACTPLYVASIYGYTEIVRALIQDSRTDVNNSECWETPLILASHLGYLEVVKLLLRCPKTKIEFKGGYENKIAKQWAIDEGHTEIADLISEESRKKLISESGISC